MKKIILLFCILTSFIYADSNNVLSAEQEKWQKLGVSVDRIHFWQDAGLKTASQFKPYNNVYGQYDRLDIIDDIKMLKKLNLKPNSLIVAMLRDWGNEKEKFKYRYEILKRSGCKTIENINFSKSDPYDNEGLCYSFWGNLLQRIDKNTGLMVSEIGNEISLVAFRKSWREGTKKSGVIKGLGKYSYETTSGYKKTVPQGLVLITK